MSESPLRNRALTGRALSIMRERGRPIELAGRPGLATVHPSYLLRLPDPDQAAAEYARFVDDLRLVTERVTVVRVAVGA